MATKIRPFRHMKAADFEIDDVRLPAYLSFKIDGIRLAVKDERPVTTKIKDVPNPFVREYLSNDPHLEGIDGECVVGPWNAPDVCRRSAEIMRKYDQPDFNLLVFDLHIESNLLIPYQERYEELRSRSVIFPKRIKLLEQHLIKTRKALLEFEEYSLNLGYEGMCARSLDGIYKYGRSTINEGYLLKRKPIMTAEAKIIGVEEEMANMNPAVRDERGLLKRSTHKANKVGKGRVGKLIAEDLKTKKILRFSGLTDAEKADAPNWIGRICTYEFFGYGVKDLPRQPRFKVLRDKRDM